MTALTPHLEMLATALLMGHTNRQQFLCMLSHDCIE